MSKRPRKQTLAAVRRQLAALVEKWRRLLHLTDWDIKVFYGERKLAGGAIGRPRKREARLYFNVPHIRERWVGPDEVEWLVVHEMLHCVAPGASEASVVHLTNAVLLVEAQVPPAKVP